MRGVTSPGFSGDHAFTVSVNSDSGGIQNFGPPRLARLRCWSMKASEQSVAAQARERLRQWSTDLAKLLCRHGNNTSSSNP
ncbi:hypothetical protein E2562_031215 [Oryza meyeriana var. granulata]|uniref:Uncharacterized protein n=1 Tax=Oryza meyeriana var. granulata TaxID=110450 RepID=A0A6G1DQP2_9ORYZ|nr:hypothetical protein E2562_031215 [Oryza meyeriana var. granulata]